jgi:hypothetical protein
MKMMFPATRMNRSFGDLASDMNQLVDTLFGAATGNQSENKHRVHAAYGHSRNGRQIRGFAGFAWREVR